MKNEISAAQARELHEEKTTVFDLIRGSYGLKFVLWYDPLTEEELNRLKELGYEVTVGNGRTKIAW